MGVRVCRRRLLACALPGLLIWRLYIGVRILVVASVVGPVPARLLLLILILTTTIGILILVHVVRVII